ncbi:DUF2452 domain-containing protein [Haloferula sargassicola]|uniref:DUF2452 domain-containing protein n=1 Tax=Haloferula sargassicola TaxID=490096 RepID=A0ABP9UMX7_9BACT
MSDDPVQNTAFIPYPVSTLSPRITPTDLSNFKSRGISQVESELAQKLVELREAYWAAIDHFNWNKLVYESDIQFEPVVGNTYHLYEARGRRQLSMIPPHEWHLSHIASVRLNVDRQWQLVEVNPSLDPASLFQTST